MGLTAGDLKNLVYPVFEIDAYKSKMGSDADIVVLSFTVNEEQPAQDLVNFIERGYSFVLDADASSGEQDDGMYRVFVEIERDKNVPEQIIELMDGIGKLSGNDKFKFRYYKGFKSLPVDINSLSEQIPLDTDSYNNIVNESNMNNFKNFFNRSYLEEIDLNEDQELFIKKAYADTVAFKVKDFGPSMQINESIKDKVNMNDYSEILFLTKYIGDYNVMKYGSRTLTFENEGFTLVVERL
jgi:hypothetical protein